MKKIRQRNGKEKNLLLTVLSEKEKDRNEIQFAAGRLFASFP